ncbi:MAG: purd: phosphoribosylamine--glycine ligase [Verrucomicrobiales bacterium]|nr:purd: phosphoribosylamine--glycine ligase [Verrucomicrobiales bacterium]
MKILVTGKGGREHALLTALAEAPSRPELFAYPGSDAIFEIAKPAPAVDLPSLMEFMRAEGIHLCVAGEESMLVQDAGLANLCMEAGIPCWGPPKESAQLEASKEFAKEFLVRHGIPTAKYAAAGSLEEARAAITPLPVVLKFDGLAAGKGVAVCGTREEADAFLDTVFTQRLFGPGRMVIEECLTGPELSIFCSVVDERFHLLTPARDYKRIRDNDDGPNTGGMGAVAGRGLVPESLLEEITSTIIKPTVAGLRKDGLPYRGFLYFGLMLTPQGPKVIEYNCRFGDPECEAVMPLLQGDLAQYLMEAAQGWLRPEMLETKAGWSVCLILASGGYPESSRSGDLITGLPEAGGARVYHCGTRRNAQGQFETHGGRVLAVVAQAETREEARDAAYAQAAHITFDGCQRRSDIATLHFS